MVAQEKQQQIPLIEGKRESRNLAYVTVCNADIKSFYNLTKKEWNEIRHNKIVKVKSLVLLILLLSEIFWNVKFSKGILMKEYYLNQKQNGICSKIFWGWLYPLSIKLNYYFLTLENNYISNKYYYQST